MFSKFEAEQLRKIQVICIDSKEFRKVYRGRHFEDLYEDIENFIESISKGINTFVRVKTQNQDHCAFSNGKIQVCMLNKPSPEGYFQIVFLKKLK